MSGWAVTKKKKKWEIDKIKIFYFTKNEAVKSDGHYQNTATTVHGKCMIDEILISKRISTCKYKS